MDYQLWCNNNRIERTISAILEPISISFTCNNNRIESYSPRDKPTAYHLDVITIELKVAFQTLPPFKIHFFTCNNNRIESIRLKRYTDYGGRICNNNRIERELSWGIQHHRSWCNNNRIESPLTTPHTQSSLPQCNNNRIESSLS